MKILGVIAARGGSKGVPRKNIRALCGKPVIAYSIETANAVKHLFHRVIVSTDDPEIRDISLQYGGDVPFLRPAELASDTAKSIDALKHAVQFIEDADGVPIDWVMLLQAADPLRLPEDIEAAIERAAQGDCDSVISVVQVFAVHPILMKRIENGLIQPFCIEEKEGTRRQDYKPDAFMRNGAIYLSKRDCIMKDNSIWGKNIAPLVMPEDRSVGIDNEIDFLVIEQLMKKRN